MVARLPVGGRRRLLRSFCLAGTIGESTGPGMRTSGAVRFRTKTLEAANHRAKCGGGGGTCGGNAVPGATEPQDEAPDSIAPRPAITRLSRQAIAASTVRMKSTGTPTIPNQIARDAAA
jgi:hypothetical protein